MADKEKYLDLEGLKAYNQIINGQKANIESPVFTGTPKIGENNIATVADIPTDYVKNGTTMSNSIWIYNNEGGTNPEIRLLCTNGNISFNAGNTITFEGNQGVNFRAGNGAAVRYNGEEIATKQDIIDHVSAESVEITGDDGRRGELTTFYLADEPLTNFTIMDGYKGERGISLLHISTAPWANTRQTPDGIVHNMCANEAEIKREAKIDEIYLGDILEWNGFIYQIGYIGDPYVTNVSGQSSKTINVYIDSIGNIKGPQGIQGIQGIQGPQGPKGDPGEGYFIVTDEDYAKIADFVEEKSYHSYQRPNASEPIRPNIFYDFGPQYQLEITFEDPQSIYRSNEYMFQFESPTDRPTTLIMPSEVKWCYDPTIEAGKTYQVSVLNNLAVICGA